MTLERLVQIFPEDITLKNDLGVAHLLIGDNKGAKRVYEEVMVLISLCDEHFVYCSAVFKCLYVCTLYSVVVNFSGV